MAGSRIVKLVACQPEDGGVGLHLEAANGKNYGMVIDLQCAPLVATAILRTAGDLQAKLSPDSPQEAQILVGKGLQGSILSNGQVGLVLTLLDGAELVFALPSEQIGPVADMLQALVPATKRRH